ncbi:hypothetical protein DB346_13605 [Verrucomicrobia bacterium LW23]|nr:hypothetical protein DB346_13605 [Verrucomicrobia bacterium LW23]
MPPADGEFRFWGLGDDILCVAVNEKIVLVSNWAGLAFPNIPWRPPAESPPAKPFGGGARIVPGDWVALKGGATVDLDVLIGERPGNLFSSFVLTEKRGETYDTRAGYPRLPILQLAPYETPTPPAGKAPLFLPGCAVWKGVE